MTPQKAIITQKKELVLGIDEMWSFVGSKRNKVWIWLAIASLTKEIVGIHVGSRERIAARQLWESSTSLWSMC
ncbi:MAG: hypothetical protein BRC51_08325 [Cyanobacteria bacterium SW_12_48_29]|nr:MAG: hypothetical protein BRC45_11685 [Cyanobacteria bacterium QS_5_48_63]PSP04128.1 MAG: hypothetical protein BRC51_08325 [Cyanobacteria bacterium SW_12_48_29]PSP20020.1 MAG: hypothetical protein BRC52_09455 [Cyanobacteria bacterium SW_5_48_44]